MSQQDDSVGPTGLTFFWNRYYFNEYKQLIETIQFASGVCMIAFHSTFLDQSNSMYMYFNMQTVSVKLFYDLLLIRRVPALRLKPKPRQVPTQLLTTVVSSQVSLTLSRDQLCRVGTYHESWACLIVTSRDQSWPLSRSWDLSSMCGHSYDTTQLKLCAKITRIPLLDSCSQSWQCGSVPVSIHLIFSKSDTD